MVDASNVMSWSSRCRKNVRLKHATQSQIQSLNHSANTTLYYTLLFYLRFPCVCFFANQKNCPREGMLTLTSTQISWLLALSVLIPIFYGSKIFHPKQWMVCKTWCHFSEFFHSFNITEAHQSRHQEPLGPTPGPRWWLVGAQQLETRLCGAIHRISQLGCFRPSYMAVSTFSNRQSLSELVLNIHGIYHTYTYTYIHILLYYIYIYIYHYLSISTVVHPPPKGTYPLGRREAGGMQNHLRSEEGQDVLRRFGEAGWFFWIPILVGQLKTYKMRWSIYVNISHILRSWSLYPVFCWWKRSRSPAAQQLTGCFPRPSSLCRGRKWPPCRRQSRGDGGCFSNRDSRCFVVPKVLPKWITIFFCQGVGQVIISIMFKKYVTILKWLYGREGAQPIENVCLGVVKWNVLSLGGLHFISIRTVELKAVNHHDVAIMGSLAETFIYIFMPANWWMLKLCMCVFGCQELWGPGGRATGRRRRQGVAHLAWRAAGGAICYGDELGSHGWLQILHVVKCGYNQGHLWLLYMFYRYCML